MKHHFYLAAALLAFTAPSIAAAQPATPATTPAAAPEPFAWIGAADRGDMAPLRAALRTSRDADERVLLDARLAASRGEAVHGRADLARLAAGPDRAKASAALNIMAANAFGRNDYATAARTAEALAAHLRAAGDMPGVAATERTQRLAALLAAAPAQRIEGNIAHASTPLTRDAVGLPRIRIGVNGGEDEAVVDTGAGLTVLSAETARRLGVRMLEGDTDVGNGVATTVAVRTGIADRLTVAGTTLRNVPVLVIDDSQLTFPQANNYRITSILGLPVLRALGRVKLDAAAFTVEPAQTFDAARQNLFADSNDLHVTATIGGHEVPLFIDTGANQMILTQRFAAAHPDLVASLETRDLRTASAGGARSQRSATWTNQPLTIGGRTATVPTINVALVVDDLSREHAGVLSSSALRLFASHTIDFRAMRLELGEPLPTTPVAPAAPPAPTRN